jgi:hypothetical protein
VQKDIDNKGYQVIYLLNYNTFLLLLVLPTVERPLLCIVRWLLCDSKNTNKRNKGIKKIKIRVCYSSVAGGRELVELCPAAMPTLNTQRDAFFGKTNLGVKDYYYLLKPLLKPFNRHPGMFWCETVRLIWFYVYF